MRALPPVTFIITIAQRKLLVRNALHADMKTQRPR